MKMLDKPSERLPKPWLTPHVIQPEHQIHFLKTHLSHLSCLLLNSRTLVLVSRPARENQQALPCLEHAIEQCSAAEIPFECGGGVPGRPRLDVSARFALVDAAWNLSVHKLERRALEGHRRELATRRDRRGVRQRQFLAPAAFGRAALPPRPRCPRKPGTSRG